MQDTGRRFRWYLAGQGCWFAGFGIQAVLLPYLVVNVLQAGPAKIGIAQMAQTAPSLVLLLLGGALADASDLRTLLFRLQLAAAVPPLVMAGLLQSGSANGEVVGYATVIGFALAYGSLQAFVVPAREALLNRVVEFDMQRAVSGALALQFAAQIVGFAVASAADQVSPARILLVQASMFALGGIVALGLPPAPALPSGPHGRLHRLGAGARLALASSRLRPVLLLMSGVGFFFISVFMVVVPVMVRDTYHGGSRALAMVNGAFVLGTIVSTLVLSRIPPIERQGRAIFVAVMVDTVLTAGFATRPPQLGFYALIFGFGLASGVLVALGRTVVQQSAPADARARVLAFYSLCLLGSAPPGAYLIGRLAEAHGVLAAASWFAGGMSALLVVVAVSTPVWALRRLPAVGG